jgi:hypothetical protein
MTVLGAPRMAGYVDAPGKERFGALLQLAGACEIERHLIQCKKFSDVCSQFSVWHSENR